MFPGATIDFSAALLASLNASRKKPLLGYRYLQLVNLVAGKAKSPQ